MCYITFYTANIIMPYNPKNKYYMYCWYITQVKVFKDRELWYTSFMVNANWKMQNNSDIYIWKLMDIVI